MLGVITLLLVLTLSIIVNRIATTALAHTGLSQQSARFQARSAFTGVGFTTSESERVVNHPVRRRILMLLMLLGNAGIVTVVASMIISFVNVRESGDWLVRFVILVGGLAVLLTLAYSRLVDRHLSRLIRHLLERLTDLEVRDYVGLLHVGGEYGVTELNVREDDWLAGRRLRDGGLREEGIIVLGVQTPDGEYLGVPDADTRIRANDTLVLYGRTKALRDLDQRKLGLGGDAAHQSAVAEQRRVEAQEREREAAEGRRQGEPS
jgi:hypothetical protein